MPLPPNASITDVINKLSELEGINQKAELASVIGDPATSTDTVAQQIVKLQTSKDLFSQTLSNKGIPTVNSEPIDDMVVKVNSISSGVRMASGTTQSISANATRTVSGLGFTPSNIILSTRFSNGDYRSSFNGYLKQLKTMNWVILAETTTIAVVNNRPNSDSFVIQNRLSDEITVEWVAYE